MDPNSLALLMGSAGAAAGPATYVEDVFSTWLYTGNSSTQTITNGIDLAGKGGLVWLKDRNNANGHFLTDTARGTNSQLRSHSNVAETTNTNVVTAFNNNGFTLGSNANTNSTGNTQASWTFRKAAKFFDVVTYTGDGSNPRSISHNLGSVPGCIIVKRTESTGDWIVYHRSTGASQVLYLNDTSAASAGNNEWDSTAPTSTHFTVRGSTVNSATTGATYVAYLFAHDAGGFGDSGNDSIISCGTFAGGGTVTLGWEPQYILWKASDATDPWRINDNMRGLPTGGTQPVLLANTSDAETTNSFFDITATGFKHLGSGNNYIYIAIRRGPMKTPTVGTEVFGLNARSGTGADATVTGGQVDDAVLIKNRGSAVGDLFAARLTGTGYLETSSTAAEVAAGTTILQSNPWDVMDGVKVGTTSTITNASGNTFINYLFRRAPGFFDVVAYTGTGANRTVSHNLGVAPELILVKRRDTSADWQVYAGAAGKYLVFNTTAAEVTSNTDRWNNTTPTSSVFSIGTNAVVNASAGTYVAYLFASASGVSKVGSYTGTGTTLSVDCGFTAGARFVLIKRTDSTGDWYVYDTARGIVSGNDPYLLINSTAAEVTNTDYIDPLSSGFQISPTAPAAINANGGSFIYLAIA